MEEQPKKRRTGYLEKNLIAGEEVTFRAPVHWIVLVGPIAAACLLGIPGLVMIYFGSVSANKDMIWLAVAGVALLVLAVAVLLPAILRRQATIFAVTNRRIILKTGLIKRRTEEILLQKVESIVVDQGFMGQMLHYGTVTMRGTGGTFEPFSHVANALELRRQVQEQIAKSH